MKPDDRKAAIAAYKERKQNAGIYLIRCVPSGVCWVGSTLNLDAIGNRHWFMLRMDKHVQAALQKAWNDHGEGAFTFERVERIDEKLSGFDRDEALQERLDHWRGEFGAEAI